MNAGVLLCSAALMATQEPPASPEMTTGLRSGTQFLLKKDPAGPFRSPLGSRYSLSPPPGQECESPCVNPDCAVCLRPAAPPRAGGDAATAGLGAAPNTGADAYLLHTTPPSLEATPSSTAAAEPGAMHAEAGHFDRGLAGAGVPGSVPGDSDVAASLACAEAQDGMGNELANADGSMASPSSPDEAERRLVNVAAHKAEAASRKLAHVLRLGRGFAGEPKSFKGGPRALVDLHMLTAMEDIFSTGMAFDTRNEAELAMAELCELQHRNYKTPRDQVQTLARPPTAAALSLRRRTHCGRRRSTHPAPFRRSTHRNHHPNSQVRQGRQSRRRGEPMGVPHLPQGEAPPGWWVRRVRPARGGMQGWSPSYWVRRVQPNGGVLFRNGQQAGGRHVDCR